MTTTSCPEINSVLPLHSIKISSTIISIHLKNRRTMRIIEFIFFTLPICILYPFLTLTCLPSTVTSVSLASSSLPLPLTSLSCMRDEHCDPGAFCNMPTKSCVPCLVDECEKWKRLPGPKSCTRSKEECGSCVNGYSDHHGHCESQSQSLLHPSVISDEEVNTRESSSDDNETFFNLGMILSVVISLLLLFGFSLLCMYWSWRRGKHSIPLLVQNKDEMEGALDIFDVSYEQPPAYNPDMAESIRFLVCDDNDMTERNNRIRPIQLDQENRAMAVAYSMGRFPTGITPTPLEDNMELEEGVHLEEPEPMEVDIGGLEAPPEIPTDSTIQIENTPVEPVPDDNPEETVDFQNNNNNSIRRSVSLPTVSLSQGLPTTTPVSLSRSVSPPPSPLMLPSSNSDSGHFSTNEQPFLELQLNFSVGATVRWTDFLHYLNSQSAPPPAPLSQRERLNISQSYVDLEIFSSAQVEAQAQNEEEDEGVLLEAPGEHIAVVPQLGDFVEDVMHPIYLNLNEDEV